MLNLPGPKRSRERGRRCPLLSTTAARGLDHFNYSIVALWLSRLSFSMIPEILVEVLITSDTKAHYKYEQRKTRPR